MKSLVRLLGLWAPAPLKKQELRNLFQVTASAFGCASPDITGRSFDDALAEYGRFTRSEIEKLRASGRETESVRERLFQGGWKLGERIRKACLLRRPEDAVSAMTVLYRTMGIEAHANGASELTVSSCSFSGVYSAEACGVVSALDDGIFAGLSRGMRLSFSRRITDGCSSCTARISTENAD
jgi:predicted ArsR family transcriptional regulator